MTTKDVKQVLENDKDFLLVDVLSSQSFEVRHIPGAKNIPYGPMFLVDFEEALGVSKDTKIAVYCASDSCRSSLNASHILEKAGYRKVSHYKDGLAGWKEAGYKFEGKSA